MEEEVEWVQKETGIDLAPSQLSALRKHLRRKVSLLPAVRCRENNSCECHSEDFHEKGLEVVLAAPTGRAAKKMSEASQMEARTIHRLLEFDPQSYSLKRS